ncbi:MAG: thiosulfate oxidation carrier protein SoxY [Candidatus Sedimenticola endophacoides]|uniref:Thiosulfate oxidation carrier protein SoxY n=1 Tax=Candidatus Sedimenticola endophacoides TaxID=2548426 RepID=A0A657Q6G5_9GAMM|nr:MAG: thiosulfate oxidation carrier protein SoxY [Candidatus Sedimenticola endophacoides]OQX34374.1 MAG: thiosulfate oxidation carrier protein SoxY [Candidatus Sedimenticola endophacoides]OQX37647.1 MAG: thiosulfate oxidation carrier protein SoxY [Candidatus Sedimenticola endophacoides]OQX39094.1 MAG: thiosulfate oxidation carrier protein SoxY [Candidatus Sedimenticola endophacoides]OQX39276.1 MAG: thiosulfate oxidation carrier protein SoxY [Candidatus Sedimenticola endophacoides]
MNIKRRVFLKGSMATGTLGVAAAAGLLSPTAVLAAWPEAAFKAKKVDEVLTNLMGSSEMSDSAEIKIKAPDIAENGTVVPISVTTTMSGIESIAIVVANNPSPLVASFNPGAGAEGFVSTRIKMGKTSDVIAVVKADGKLHSARKEVKVTIGGCGG